MGRFVGGTDTGGFRGGFVTRFGGRFDGSFVGGCKGRNKRGFDFIGDDIMMTSGCTAMFETFACHQSIQHLCSGIVRQRLVHFLCTHIVFIRNDIRYRYSAFTGLDFGYTYVFLV